MTPEQKRLASMPDPKWPKGNPGKKKKKKNKNLATFVGSNGNRVKPTTRTPNISTKKAISSHKGEHDARVSNTSNVSLMAPGVSPAVVVTPSMSPNMFWGVAYGYVDAAIQRGFLSRVIQPSDPFAAASYIVMVLSNSATGITPAAEKLPMWLKCLCDAVSPVNDYPFGNGGVSYKFSSSSGPGALPSALNSTPAFYGLETLLYVDNQTGQTDLFPWATAPSVPTLEEMSTAFNGLTAFMATLGGSGAQMVSVGTNSTWVSDVSAFSFPTCVTGYGYGDGGWAYVAQLEVPITAPMLSTINGQLQVTQGGALERWGEKPKSFGGDSLFLGNAWGSLFPPTLWKMQKKPRFHQIDFNEFADVLAQWLTLAINQYFIDTPMSVSVADGGDIALIASNMVCPITLQEMTILLHNEVMALFGDTQAGVQGLGIMAPVSGVPNFVPFQAGTNTAGIRSMQMKLPLGLVENLKSLTWRVATNTNGGDPVCFYPIVGYFIGDALMQNDYSTVYPGQEGATFSQPTFTNTPPMEVRRFAKTKDTKEEWVKLGLETPIRLSDGFDGTNYVFINDEPRLKALTALWNEFVSSIAAYSSALTTLSSDGGINVLTSINQTRHLAAGTIPSIASRTTTLVRKDSKSTVRETVEIRDTRFSSRPMLSATPFSGRQVYATSYQTAPFSSTLEITENWILPVNWILLQGNGQSTDFTRVQLIEDEPYSTIYSTTGNNGIDLGTIHTTFATSMVKSRSAPDAPFDSSVKSLSDSGHAGVLSQVVGQFLNTGAQVVGSFFGL